eukprot:gnl/MRDRNA2_/MRDRNA2_99084_c0_seq1.p1 gnl/MRDRNA2_/MRDRNA2_99084_c0~~gnl/MRDRNA2_/MRDRNA2_99084_c0_seq1.p1  ORF type:complete len:532 (+),score=123.21 gnl/MRDRNA2_/MRDRNA2_99084_c0_seq1:50-1645(+)
MRFGSVAPFVWTVLPTKFFAEAWFWSSDNQEEEPRQKQQRQQQKKAAPKKKGANYYELLGVPRKADNAAIKKAFREKSLLYHPDKCTEEKDVCQAKFIEVSNANEVLQDKEKRKIYDQHGEEGLKEGAQSDDGQAAAMFRQFFGREPNGKVRIVQQGGMMQFVEEGEEGPAENLYDESNVVELSDETWNAFVGDRDEPWVILFYKPNVDECVEIVDEYKQFAKTFSDFLKVASVNCRKQADICRKNSVSDFPGVRWFSEDKSKDPEVFEGLINAKLLGKWVSNLMKDHSTIVSDKMQLREFIESATTPPVVLFTDKKEVPPMWKSLSREFRKRVALATVLRCDKSGVFKNELQREFDVRIPAIIRLSPADALGTIAERFSSEFRTEVIRLWLTKVIAISRKAGPTAAFKEWSKARVNAGDCGPKDSQFCFLWLKAGADKMVEESMRSLAVKYRTDPIKMMWVSTELNPTVLDAFGLENSDATDFFVAYRSKRGKFKVHEGDLTFGELDNFVDGVLGGGPLVDKVRIEKLEL